LAGAGTKSRERRPSAGKARFRTVIFGSRRARLVWGLAGLLALAGGFLLARPSFDRSAPAALPWGLWIGTDSPYAPNAGHLLQMRVEANGCGEPVVATGSLDWAPADRWFRHHSSEELIPGRLVLGIAGATVIGAEVRDFRRRRWRPIQVRPYHGIAVADGRVRGTRGYGEPEVRFRLLLDAPAASGFEACSVASPALLEYQGGEKVFERATEVFGYLEGHVDHDVERVEAFDVSDGLIWMKVAGHQPDRSMLTTGTGVRGNRVLVTCTSSRYSGSSRDPFSYFRQAVEEPSCATVQTFRAAGAEETLSERIFFAGILISAGVALLIEALIGGGVDQVERISRRRA